MTIDEMAALHVGQVVPIQVPDQAEGEKSGKLGMVDLVIGNQVKFRGRTGLRGKNLAVQVEEITAPPLELVSHKDGN
jgi:flagellar motor switch protein FliM